MRNIKQILVACAAMSHRLMIMGCVKMNVALIDLLRLTESVDVQKVCNCGEMVIAVMLLR